VKYLVKKHWQKSSSVRYSIGIYVRESRDDNEENYETIETQRDLLMDFVKRNDLGSVFKVYIDDNVSGSGFEREGLDELKEDVISGKIDMIVAKDLSRLGRNNAKTLLLLDFLEEYGTRVITFDGRYDSLKDNDTVGIETWFNERYIRDISRKIRANLRYKIEKGEYIGHAPFGYIKSSEEKNKLVINDESAKVVREIFDMYCEGYGYAYIARLLNEKGYTSPSGKALWNAVAVQRILGSRVYIGDTVQGVSEKVSFKSKRTRRLPQNKWVITENTHEAIVTREQFDKVEKIRQQRRKSSGPHKGSLHTFRGLLYCGRCGSVMFARARKNRPLGYICGSYSKKGKKACESHYISEKTVSDCLIKELNVWLEKPGLMDKVNKLLAQRLRNRSNDAQLSKMRQQLCVRQKQQDAIYIDKLEGKISEQLFLRMNANVENKIEQLKAEIRKLGSVSQHNFDIGKAVADFFNYIEKNGLTRDIVSSIVEKIFVFNAEDIEISSNIALAEDQKIYAKENGALVIDFYTKRV
jgi:site-specific DNA recombinase